MISMDNAVPATLGWWARLRPDPVTGRRGDPGALAALRRAASPADACLLAPTADLARRIGNVSPTDYIRVGALAMTLAHLREDRRGVSLPRLLGVQAGSTEPVLKPLRWEALLRAEDVEERAVMLRRVLAILNNAAPLRDIVAAVVGWNEQRRVRWSHEYWNAGAPLAADIINNNLEG